VRNQCLRGRFGTTREISGLARQLVLLLCLCLIGQPALARLVPGCAHAGGAARRAVASAATEAQEAAAHAHHGAPADRASSGCDCGCACAGSACAHANAGPALPVPQSGGAVASADKPRFAWATAGPGDARSDRLLRPPIGA
jgi:hypothetical protein